MTLWGPRLAGGLWLAWLAGQIVRDSFMVAGLCFYLPSPLVALFTLAASFFAWHTGNVKWRRLFLAMALLPTLSIVFLENHWFLPAAAPAPGASVRLVHWNVMRGKGGWDGVVDILAAEHASLIILSEFPKGQDPADLAVRLGQGFTSLHAGSMAVIARGELDQGVWLEKKGGLLIYSARWRFNDVDLKIFAVDLVSNPLVGRAKLLRRLMSQMQNGKPDLVAGDFNAPRRSMLLNPLPEPYHHAYDEAGAGWSYTWPSIFPVLAIDQCIMGPSVQPLSYQLRNSIHSDHRRQVFDFARRTLPSHPRP